MKKFLYVFVMIFIAGLTFYGCQEQATQPDNSYTDTQLFAVAGSPDEFDLKIDGTTKIGILQVWDNGTNLYIKFIIDEPWCFTETEIKVAISDISSATPLTHTTFNPCTEDTFIVPLSTFATDLCGSNLLISAEATVQNCDGFNIYGIESAAGPGKAKVYMVDLNTKIVTEDFSVRPTTYTSLNMSPNSLAYDPLTKRMYYADLNKTTTQTDQSMLYFYDYNTSTEYDAGLLPAGEYACADFYEGNMYLIEDNSDDLYRVTFNSNGTISMAGKIADICSNTHAWGFYGDLSIKDGILYGWASNYLKGSPGSAGTYELFQYNVSTLSGFSFVVPTYQKSLQNSFGSDGVLYGHRASNTGGDAGQFYPINLVDGSLGTAITFTSPDNRLYNDLSTAPVCYNKSAWVPEGENNYFTYRLNCCNETAWGGNTGGLGNAWWYYFIVGTSPQTLYADGNVAMGEVTYNGTNLTITLNSGWYLQDLPEAVKIQGYPTLAGVPTKRPVAGQFTTYKGTDLIIPLSGYAAFAIHLDVQHCNLPPL